MIEGNETNQDEAIVAPGEKRQSPQLSQQPISITANTVQERNGNRTNIVVELQQIIKTREGEVAESPRDAQRSA